ncbi:MAG: DUF3598 family protein [Leptolyngbyaceae cyanobacterium]
MTSQWERLLKNTGRWQGSFTQISPTGSLLADIPSVVALTPLDDGNLMRQIIVKQSGDTPDETVLEYRSLAKSVLFLENGAFSQGSIQWGPFSEFGAELGLIADNERLRLVQRFDKSRALHSLTLMREHLAGTTPVARSQTTVADLLGTWVGTATTTYPDLRPDDTYPTRLEVAQQGDRVEQTLQLGSHGSQMQSREVVGDRRILFTGGSQAVQVLLLPGGASSTCPIAIEPRQPIILEVGWLLSPHRRQRLIRQYNAQGTWSSLTLVDESKVV